MAAENGAEVVSPMDEVMVDIRRELVRRVGVVDRGENRGIYDVLETE